MSDHSPEPTAYVPWNELLRSGHTGSLLLVCLAVWLHAADSLVVATMLPSMVADIGGAALVSWTVSIYEIGSVVAGAASALLTMRYGLRRPMAAAALAFAFGCALSAVSPVMEGVLLGRAFQGLGGGGLVAMGFVASGVLFPRRYRARVMAAISAFWGMSAFLGPLLGGLFVEFANWRIGFGFFAVQASLLALWIYLRDETVTPQSEEQAAGFPLSRLALLCVAVVLVSMGGVRVEALRTTVLILAGLACLVLFLRLDARATVDRLLPLGPMDPRHATGATLLLLLMISMATIAILAYGPILVTTLHGVSALTGGYLVAASSVGWTAAAIAVSGAPERQDRMWIVLGMSLTALSIPGFAYAVPAGPMWLIAALSFIEGAGFGMAWTFILRRVTALAPSEEVSRVSGALPTVQRIGYALGAAYVGIVANAAGFVTMETPDEVAQVARVLFLACVPLAVIGLAAMLGLVRGHPHDDTLG